MTRHPRANKAHPSHLQCLLLQSCIWISGHRIPIGRLWSFSTRNCFRRLSLLPLPASLPMTPPSYSPCHRLPPLQLPPLSSSLVISAHWAPLPLPLSAPLPAALPPPLSSSLPAPLTGPSPPPAPLSSALPLPLPAPPQKEEQRWEAAIHSESASASGGPKEVAAQPASAGEFLVESRRDRSRSGTFVRRDFYLLFFCFVLVFMCGSALLTPCECALTAAARAAMLAACGRGGQQMPKTNFLE